jgi:ubiquinone/menaquinone biosynthesis C-methylase UbiE
MGWLAAAIYDRMMVGTEEACLSAWRETLLAQTSGEVLELGAGTGANLAYYPAAVERVRLAEPDPGMRGRLAVRAREQSRVRVEVADHAAERLPYDDGTFEAVVSTLVLCSVLDPAQALREVHRVLKPGGSFVFIEHVGAEQGSPRRLWQGRIEPIWTRVAGNCHLTRDTEGMIEDAGLTITSVERQSLRKAVPWVRPSIRGLATRSSEPL